MLDLKTLGSSIWLADPNALTAMRRAIRGATLPARIDNAVPQLASTPMRKSSGKIAIMDIQGVIEQRTSFWGYLFGSFSTEAGSQALAKLVAAGDIAKIVLNIDSPGGTSYGVEEFSSAVRDAGAKKPIYAIANSMAASAAYWIASQATQLMVTPGGEVGSVGVYMMHADYSKALEEEGIDVTIVAAGKYKAERNSFQPLTEAARENMQEEVDDLYVRFVKAVADGRRTTPQAVRDSYGKGRCLLAAKALAAGMCDKIMTLDQLLDRLGGEAMPADGMRASAEVLRLRHAMRKLRTQEK